MGGARAAMAGRRALPPELPYVQPPPASAKAGDKARAVFVYFINGAKERAPAAAQHLIGLL